MENSSNENLLSPKKQESSLTISEAHAKIIVAIGEVNKLGAFPLGKDELTDWASDVMRLSPEVESQRLDFLFDLYKTEQLVWDRNKGIQNIFSGLRLIG